ncbi:hypothetical protein [Celeribacter sp.]|uniref:hypothetical protein n=1 Tax=Celeribacter sp. TaxID=1890673 RepID=UPI003A90431A
MSTSKIALLSLLMAGLTACGGPNKSVGPGGGTSAVVTAITDLRGTADENLSASRSIVRLHAAETDPSSSDFDYHLVENSVTVEDNGNSLIITGMPFDGNDSYVRVATAGNPTGVAGAGGDFYLYRNAQNTMVDEFGIGPIPQNGYLAIHQTSDNGKAYVTIVASTFDTSDGWRTNGFIYGRNGGVTLPTENQGDFVGDYAAIRTFNNDKRLEYISGAMALTIDFEKLNSAGAVRFNIDERKAYDADGNFLGNLSSFGGTAANGALDAQGEFQAEGTIGTLPGAEWDEDAGEYVEAGDLSGGSGTIQGLISGAGADQVAVGTLVLDGGDYVFNAPIWIDRNDDGIIQTSTFGAGYTTTVGGEATNADGTTLAGGLAVDSTRPTAEDEIFYAGDASYSGGVNELGAFMLDRSR